MPELHGTVVNNQGTPLAGAVVTLIGSGAPQVQVTDAQGLYHFSNLAPGNYSLLAAKQGHHAAPLSNLVITANEDTEKTITMSATGNPEAPPQDAQAKPTAMPEGWAGKLVSVIQKSVTLVQTVALSTIALVFAAYLLKPFGKDGINFETLGEDAIARGAITYLVSVGTITIAMVLVLFVILSAGNEMDRKERFTMGKEVLTTLIGVLGTIIGFYYGSTIVKEPSPPPSNMQMATVKLTPDQLRAGTSVNFGSLVTGGEKPYTYSIKFYKDVIQPVVNQPSNDGKISQDISIPENVPPGEISFQIEVKDKKGAVYTYNKDGQQKLTVLPRQPSQ